MIMIQKTKGKNNSNELFEKINENINNMRKEINNMVLTDQTGISDELSYLTPIQLRQEKFSPEIINKLNYSFIGKNTEEGRISFFRELSKKLASDDFSRLLKAKTFLSSATQDLENQHLLLKSHPIYQTRN